MYLQSLKLLRPMVKEITKKVHHKMLLSTRDFMWPLNQQNLMLLHPMIKKMNLQEYTLVDLDLGFKVALNVLSALYIV